MLSHVESIAPLEGQIHQAALAPPLRLGTLGEGHPSRTSAQQDSCLVKILEFHVFVWIYLP